MFTGKNKEQFREFYKSLKQGGVYEVPYEVFCAYCFEMQLGVFLAYADSLGYSINIIDCYIKNAFRFYNTSCIEEPIEAYKEAFKKFDEIVNEQLK